MKKIGLMLAVLVAASTAMATVSVQWVWSEIPTGPVNGSDGNMLAIGSTVELMWSADQVIGGADILLDTQTTTSAGFWNFGVSNYDATDATWGLAEDTFVGGYVYQIAYDGLGFMAFSESGQINGPLLDQDDAGGASTGNPETQSALYTTGTFGGPWTQVPEPGTIALLAMGVAVLGAKRFARKN